MFDFLKRWIARKPQAVAPVASPIEAPRLCGCGNLAPADGDLCGKCRRDREWSRSRAFQAQKKGLRAAGRRGRYGIAWKGQR